jgi:hypothetical protein
MCWFQRVPGVKSEFEENLQLELEVKWKVMKIYCPLKCFRNRFCDIYRWRNSFGNICTCFLDYFPSRVWETVQENLQSSNKIPLKEVPIFCRPQQIRSNNRKTFYIVSPVKWFQKKMKDCDSTQICKNLRVIYSRES